MPSQQEVKWSQLKVGLIVLASVALLCFLLFLMTSASGMSLFAKDLIVHTYFANSSGLKVGAPVNLEGVTIGEVKRVRIVTDPAHKLTPVLVVMKLDPKWHESLHTDSTASLSTVGVLGDTVIDINSETAVGPELRNGAQLQTLETPNLEDVVKASQGTVESLNVILAKLNRIMDTIQSGQGSVGKLVQDPALYNEATATLTQLHTLTTNLNEGKGSAGKLLHDNDLYNHLNDTVAKFDEIANSLNDGHGSAGKLLKDDTLYNNLNSTLAHANSILAEADAGKGGLGLLTKDPAFAKKLNDTVTQLDTVLSNVNAGKGTLGKFATDDEAYTNLNKLLVSSNDLVTTIRKDPKKYLTIHMKSSEMKAFADLDYSKSARRPIMVQLDLDEAVEADLASQANARGIKPEQLAEALVRAGLRAELAGESLREMRHEVIEAMKRDRKGQTLGLNGMSVREFAHLDHKY